MKRDAIDDLLSKYVRTRDGWNCQRCGKNYAHKTRALDNAHMFGRGRMSTRYDPAVCVALCYGCHRWLDTHPVLKKEWFIWWLSEHFPGVDAEQRYYELEVKSKMPARKLDKVAIKRGLKELLATLEE